MAPEVLEGSVADKRSDIFSLGCVLYEMITGKPAFAGKSRISAEDYADALVNELEKSGHSRAQMTAAY